MSKKEQREKAAAQNPVVAMIVTKDGEVAEEQAVVLNLRRSLCLARLVRQNQLDGFKGDARLEAEKVSAELKKAEAKVAKAEAEMAATTDEKQKSMAMARLAQAKEAASQLKKQLVKLNAVKTADFHLKALEQKGPVAYLFASADSPAAAPYQQFYGAQDRSQFPEHFGETPEIFIPYLVAKKAWDTVEAKREREKAEREAEAARKREAEAEDTIAAADERDRQAQADLDLMSALEAEADPDLQARLDKVREQKQNQRTKENEARLKRLAATRADLEKVLDSKMSARQFFNKEKNRRGISDSDPHVLSIGNLARCHNEPETGVCSSLPSSEYEGLAGDTYIGSDGREHTAWQVLTFPFPLVNGKDNLPVLVDDPKGGSKKVQATAPGYIVLRAGRDFEDSEVSQLKRLIQDRKEDWAEFKKTHYLRDLLWATKWASEILSGGKKRDSNTSPSDTPPEEPKPNDNSSSGKTSPENGKTDSTETGKDSTSTPNDTVKTGTPLPEGVTVNAPRLTSSFGVLLAEKLGPATSPTPEESPAASEGEDEELVEFTAPAESVAKAMAILHGKKDEEDTAATENGETAPTTEPAETEPAPTTPATPEQ